MIKIIRHLIVPLCFLAYSLDASSQDYIDEDFLDVIGTNARLMLADPAPAFRTNNTPDRWNGESAVVIGYARSIMLDRESRGGFLTRKEKSLWFLEKNHFKIKLQDNNSVQAFSEVYFRYGHKDDGFIARIIKSDGTMTEIDLKNAVGVENNSDVPEYFQSFFDKVANSEYTYYKTPISDLEPGDILEYVTTTRSKLDVSRSGYIEFPPVYEVCSKKYPLMHNEIAIETDDNSYFKFLSLNGAPRFEKQTAAEPGFFRYVFVDSDRSTEKDINFVNPFTHYPMVKFQVIYSTSEEMKGALIGSKGELKSGFSREELAKKAWEEYEMQAGAPYSSSMAQVSVQNAVSQCWAELSKLGAKNWTDKVFIEKAYYQVRNKVVFRDTYFSDKVFAYIFSSLLKQKDIEFDLVITIGNNIGKLDEVLFDEEIRYIVKVGDNLYFNVTDYSNPGELVQSLLDCEAYIISKPAKKTGEQEIKSFRLPGTTFEENAENVVIKAQLSSDMRNLMVVRTSTYTGLSKARNSSYSLRYIPYMFDDYRSYGGRNPTESMSATEIPEYLNSVRSLKEEFKKQKEQQVKNSLENEFDQKVENVRFEIEKDGRTLKKKELVVKEGFELTSMVRRAGQKYLVNLAGLVAGQLQIRKEERNRTHDIDVDYPRMINWEISFKIPEGYKAEGLQELEQTVENDAGAFSLVARESEGNIVLTIRKVYRTKTIPASKWTDMLAFIDAAYNSSFKYVLLTPVGK